jgi:hypothetical protein
MSDFLILLILSNTLNTRRYFFVYLRVLWLLPADWQICGTAGFANPAGASPIHRRYFFVYLRVLRGFRKKLAKDTK